MKTRVGPRPEAKTDSLIKIGFEAVLFHSLDGTAFADLPVSGHRETWPVRSKGYPKDAGRTRVCPAMPSIRAKHEKRVGSRQNSCRFALNSVCRFSSSRVVWRLPLPDGLGSVDRIPPFRVTFPAGHRDLRLVGS